MRGAARSRRPSQEPLPLPTTWGGRRPGAGRKPKGAKARFRLVHFSVQRDHVHLLVEASSREALIRGVQGLARALRTPREVRHALIYVLRNVRKHHPGFRGVDPCASETTAARRVVVSAETWLLRVGWTRRGPIGADEAPRAG